MVSKHASYFSLCTHFTYTQIPYRYEWRLEWSSKSFPSGFLWKGQELREFRYDAWTFEWIEIEKLFYWQFVQYEVELFEVYFSFKIYFFPRVAAKLKMKVWKKCPKTHITLMRSIVHRISMCTTFVMQNFAVSINYAVNTHTRTSHSPLPNHTFNLNFHVFRKSYFCMQSTQSI